MTPSVPTPPTVISPDLGATPQILVLEGGMYAFSVRDGGRDVPPGHLPAPFIQITEAPGNPPDGRVDIMSTSAAGCLCQIGDTVVVRVSGRAARVLFTSYRPLDHVGHNLVVDIQRLGASPAAALPDQPVQRVVRTEILAHIQDVGDQRFTHGHWVGQIDQKRWIEAFAVFPLEELSPQDLEYKAVTANAWETPWIEGGSLIGTRGIGMPLIGFAVRLRGAAAERYECLYEGHFISGAHIGPLTNGALCRSDAVGDHLDGLLIRIVTKAAQD